MPSDATLDRVIEEERLRQELRGKSKGLALVVTFFFPFIGFLYSTNYVWAAIALVIDLINLLLIFALGLGIFTGLIWRFIALIIANHGINRYRRKKLNYYQARVEASRSNPAIE